MKCASAARYGWNWILGYCEDEYQAAREAAIAAEAWKLDKKGNLILNKKGKPIPAAWEFRADIIEERRIEALASEADDWISVVVQKGPNAGQTKKVLNTKPYRNGLPTTWEGRLNRFLSDHRDSEARWLKEVHAHCYGVAGRVAATYGRFFQGKGGKPRFKRKGKHDSFTIQIFPENIAKGKILVPKVGWVRVAVEDPKARIQGKATSLTVTRRADWWECSVTATGVEMPDPMRRIGPIIGLDLGITSTVTIARSDRPGEVEDIAPPRPLARNLEHLARLQQRFSQRKDVLRCRKCQADTEIPVGVKRQNWPRTCSCEGRLSVWRSNRARLLQMKIARLHYRISKIREDHLHKLSHLLTSTELGARTIVTEGYDVAKLVSKGVKKRKKKTRRAMLDIGWGELRRQLDYKCEWSGIKFVKVARNMATDQTCHKCRTENKMPDNTSKYVCAGCGNETTRQANTAWLLISEVTRTAEGDSAAGRDVPPRKRKREKPVPKTPIRENRKNV